MIAILSPAQNLDFTPVLRSEPLLEPQFLEKAQVIVNQLKQISLPELKELFKVNPDLARLNFERYQRWEANPNPLQLKAALFAFNGEVYRGLDALSLNGTVINYLRQQLRILSGLYGVLKPFDGIQPYRLEVATPLEVGDAKSLYHYWRDDVTQAINDAVNQSIGDNVMINLASNEYFKVFDQKKLKCNVVHIEFKEDLYGKLKNIVVYIKRARGLMVRFMAVNQIEEAEHLKAFDAEGYRFSEFHSSKDHWVFIRQSH
jgi:cytoplasmic iron level regulating protein YaaA (DUF328/UPF0246 family)